MKIFISLIIYLALVIGLIDLTGIAYALYTASRPVSSGVDIQRAFNSGGLSK